MAQGDNVADTQNIAAAGFLTIQPGAGVEWIIHNINMEAEFELTRLNASNEMKMDEETTEKVTWLQGEIHITNTNYLRVKNTNAGARDIGYDGIISKE